MDDDNIHAGQAGKTVWVFGRITENINAQVQTQSL